MNIETLTQEEINEIVFEAMSELPDDIKSVIQNSDWHSVIRSLVQKYGLRVDKGNLLENHTLFTMIGINKPEHLINVIESFELEPEKTTSLISEIESLIFDKIKDTIMATMPQEEKDRFSETLLKKDEYEVDNSSDDRDAILAEIEKEPVLPDMENLKARNIPHPSAPIDTREPIVSFQSKAQDEIEPLSGGKISKPFSISSETDVQVQSTPISSGGFVTPEVASREVVIGIQKDPISSGLNNMTAMTPQPSATIPQNPPQVRATDPYREPIE